MENELLAAGWPPEQIRALSSLWPGLGRKPPPQSPDTPELFHLQKNPIKVRSSPHFIEKEGQVKPIQCESWCLLSKPLAFSCLLNQLTLLTTCSSSLWLKCHQMRPKAGLSSTSRPHIQVQVPRTNYLLPPPFSSQVLSVCPQSHFNSFDVIIWQETLKSNTPVWK